MADTHDNLTTLRRAIGLFRDYGCGLIIHAGDFVAPFAARELEIAGCPVQAVFGNCDGERQGLETVLAPLGGIHDEPFPFEYSGKKFLLVHRQERLAGHSPDFLICGHTHKPEVRKAGNSLVINPGEACGWLTGRCTAAVLDLGTGEAEILSLA